MSAEHKAPADEIDIAIVRMTEHDLLEVVEIEEQSGLSRWGWAAYYASSGGNRELMLVAKPSRVPRSSIEPGSPATSWPAKRPANCTSITSPSGTSIGVAGMAVCCLDKCSTRRVESSPRRLFSRSAAEIRRPKSLYEKCGFKPIAKRANYYSDPMEDAVVMSLDLRSN